MSFVLRVSNIGGGYYFHIPALMVHKEKIKHGDLFELEIDAISPTYTIKKIGNNANV